jgi:ribonuclease Z
MILTLADSVAGAREAQKQNTQEKNKRLDKAKIPEPENQWLNIHGGKNLTHMLATARRFVFRKGMPLHTTEFRVGSDQPKENWAPTWQDDKLKVWSMVLEREREPGHTARKRSHDEFTGEVPVGSMVAETEEEQEDRRDQMRKAVLSSMFASDWRMDALVKKKLSEVERPAAIFRRDSQGRITKYSGPTLSEDPTVPDIEVLVRNPWPGAMIQKLPSTEPSTASVCYIIKNFPQRGKFDAKAAIALGVKPGKAFGKLSGGESVTTESGNVVAPEQVIGKTKEGGGFAVVDLPDRSYIPALISRQEWTATELMEGVGAIIWILGPGVLEDLRIQNFMQENSKLKHIVSSKDTCSNHIALESSASAAIRLHLLDSERFPIPKHNNEIPTTKSDTLLYTKARTGLTLQLEPKIDLQTKEIVSYLDTEAVVKETPQEVINLADEARRHLDSQEFQTELDKNQEDIPSKDAEVCTLGTGSALPSKYRNVSATLLRVPGYGNYLFDCGENTLGQLKRVYGDELPAILRDLKVIWISHLHADHHLGTASVIKAWTEEIEKQISLKDTKLMVASEDGMLHWLKEYALVEDYGYERVKPICLSRVCDYQNVFGRENVMNFGLTSITACPVQHCNNAMAVVFDFSNGFKVAYSGDCRPSNDFARIGQGATLLIHEATFDDELQGDAIAKKHSTTAEALDIGRKMGARRILLTHFSQRYQKIPVMDSHGGKDQVAIVAFDYMKVKIGDFAKIEAFKPALIKLYEEKGKKGEDDD